MHCPICKSPGRSMIDVEFIQWEKISRIVEYWSNARLLDQYGNTGCYPFTEEDLAVHTRVTKLNKKKQANTELLHQRIIDWGMDHMADLDIKARDVIASASRLEKLHGREIAPKDNNPPRLVLIGIPMPGGVMTGESDAPVFEGQVVQALPAAPIEEEVNETEKEDDGNEQT